MDLTTFQDLSNLKYFPKFIFYSTLQTMGWLPMYMLEPDVEFLNDWINQESELAFLISNGPKKWIAKKEFDIKSDLTIHKSFYMLKDYSLWHIPSGGLPLLGEGKGSSSLRFTEKDFDEETIHDPFNGWTELRTGANSNTPYFGPGHPGILHLKIRLSPSGEIPMSDFQWIGNHYKIIGNGAEKSTEVLWNKIRRMAKKVATQIPRCNDASGKKEIYAFPRAYKEIMNGRPCSLN